MHLIAKGLLQEFKEELEEHGCMISEDASWWGGYAIGLLTAGSITQREHDKLVSDMADVIRKKEEVNNAR